MREVDKLARLISFALLLAAFYSLIRLAFPLGMDSTDIAPWNRSGMSLYTDRKTGCQYLGTFGGITPRLNAAGKHEGCIANVNIPN